MTVNVFSVPIFFILFRGIYSLYLHSDSPPETLEVAIIVSVLLSIVHTSLADDVALRKRLIKKVGPFNDCERHKLTR